MSNRALITIGTIVGSTIGGYLPTFFGVGIFSYTSILLSGVGAILGILIANHFSD
jgi:uncharacterized membrane protein YeaQ/YmgE (transglycosylase-associated protein family)